MTICPDQIGGTSERPTLLGNMCRACNEPFFPSAQACTRCTSVELAAVDLGDRGQLWSWTLQMFEPKPPFDGHSANGEFQPFGVGYVELACGLKVEARLVTRIGSEFQIGQPMRLVLEPYRSDDRGQPVFTYSFEVEA